MQGLHLTADLRGCAASALSDDVALRERCLAAVEQAGLCSVDQLFHRFPRPGGVTGVVLLAESHLAVHTWPELGVATLDVYVCNLGSDNSRRAHALMDSLIDFFSPRHIERHALQRGALPTEALR